MISKECRVCKSQNLKKVFSLGKQPLANNLSNNKFEKTKKYPLELNICKECFNCQLSYVADPKILFNKYLYKSSISKSFRDHFTKSAKKYVSDFKIKKNSLIMDIGSNDGIALRPYQDLKIKNLIGVEPAKNLANITNKMGIKTHNSFFNKTISSKYKNKIDLILASNVFAHIGKLDMLTKNIMCSLKPNGILIIEVQYLGNMLRENSFENIYHEHVNYWSLNSLINFFKRFNLTIFKCEKIKTHGGSIRVYIKKNENKLFKTSKNIKLILNEEKKFNNYSTYKKFKIHVNRRKNKIQKILKDNFKLKNKTIIGYGAPAKATTLINYFKIQKYLSYIYDDNPLKSKKYIPGTSVYITNIKPNKKVSCVIVFAWNYFDEIKKNNKNLSNNFLSIFN